MVYVQRDLTAASVHKRLNTLSSSQSWLIYNHILHSEIPGPTKKLDPQAIMVLAIANAINKTFAFSETGLHYLLYRASKELQELGTQCLSKSHNADASPFLLVIIDDEFFTITGRTGFVSLKDGSEHQAIVAGVKTTSFNLSELFDQAINTEVEPCLETKRPGGKSGKIQNPLQPHC